MSDFAMSDLFDTGTADRSYEEASQEAMRIVGIPTMEGNARFVLVTSEKGASILHAIESHSKGELDRETLEKLVMANDGHVDMIDDVLNRWKEMLDEGITVKFHWDLMGDVDFI